jgi:tRNA 2-selenouridine synthase
MAATPEHPNAPYFLDALWAPGTASPFDEVIDVRSPGEFAEDHLPGAVNRPVLNDAERAEVGTIFREQGPFTARKIGAAYVSANIAAMLRESFAGLGKEYRPLVMCWRGGQRSQSLATVLSQIGWRVAVLRGGYRTYRAHVRRELETRPGTFTYRVVAGATGSGKTRLLHALAARGHQALDLEALARHRGSVLGADGAQPTQKGFETRLLDALAALDPARPVWVESESNRIGNVFLPPALWAKMRDADGIELLVPPAERVRYLIEAYANLTAEPDGLKRLIVERLPRHGPRQLEQWGRWIDDRDWPALVASLLACHYDPAYEASARKCFPNVTRTVAVADVSPESFETLIASL